MPMRRLALLMRRLTLLMHWFTLLMHWLALLMHWLALLMHRLTLLMHRLALLIRSPASKTLRFYAKLYLAITRIYPVYPLVPLRGSQKYCIPGFSHHFEWYVYLRRVVLVL